jgi:UDP-2-acetamido-3-amino-2,3-dideoxy-glucuronate N-acetyltransferase
VVTKDVPAFALMVGNPARRVGWVSRHGEKLCFDKDGFAVCPATGDKYQLVNDVCQLIDPKL